MVRKKVSITLILLAIVLMFNVNAISLDVNPYGLITLNGYCSADTALQNISNGIFQCVSVASLAGDTNETVRMDSIIDTCPSGTVIQNLTTGGIECVSLASASDTNETVRVDAITDVCSSGQVVQNITDGGIECVSLASASDTNETVRVDELVTNTTGTTAYIDSVDANALHLNQDNWFNSSDDSIYWDGDSLELRGTTYYNVSSVYTEVGTPSATSVLSYIQQPDDVTYNITESGSDLTFYANFTEIVTFNQLIIHYQSTVDETDELLVYLWNNETLAWDFITELSGTTGIATFATTIAFPQKYINELSEVQVRFFQEATGLDHEHYFDWVTLSKGIGATVASETDPTAVKKNRINTTTMVYSGSGLNLSINESWLIPFIIGYSGNITNLTLNDSSQQTQIDTALSFVDTNETGRMDVIYGDQGNFTFNNLNLSFLNVTNIEVSDVINQTADGTIRSFSNGCREIANSTDVGIIC